MEPLKVSGRATGPRTVVALAGELTIGTAQQADHGIHQARAEHGEHLVLDLSGLEFLDSMGLRTLLKYYLAAEDRGGSAVLTGPLAPRVERALTITGLNQRLVLFPALDEALNSPLPTPPPDPAAGQATATGGTTS
ncbi:STAS domain-containing protein [Spirillospora sp. NPDC050679]